MALVDTDLITIGIALLSPVYIFMYIQTVKLSRAAEIAREAMNIIKNCKYCSFATHKIDVIETDMEEL